MRHSGGGGGVNGGMGSRPGSRGPGGPGGRGPQQGMRPHGQHMQQQMKMWAQQQSFLGGGMQGGVPRGGGGGMGGGGHVGGMGGGGMGGGGSLGGWAQVNPAAARAMLLAQQQGQPWVNEQLPMFQSRGAGTGFLKFLQPLSPL